MTNSTPRPAGNTRKSRPNVDDRLALRVEMMRAYGDFRNGSLTIDATKRFTRKCTADEIRASLAIGGELPDGFVMPTGGAKVVFRGREVVPVAYPKGVMCALQRTAHCPSKHGHALQITHPFKRDANGEVILPVQPDETYAEMDRKLPGAKGGEYKLHNLQPACKACNLDKSDKLI